MKGLLLKDIYTLTRQMRIFLVMIVIFSVIPGMSMSGFAIVYAAMLPYTAMAYDERSHWNQLARMMPYTNSQIVLSKYILGWGAVLAATLLSALGSVAATAFGLPMGSTSFAEGLAPLPAVAGAAFILLAVTLPLMFRLGVERGRMVFLVVVVVSAVSATTLLGGLTGADDGLALLLGMFVPAVALVLQPISIALSSRWFAAAER